MIIVVGVDDSPLAPRVLNRALEEARLKGAELHAVHVFHAPVVFSEVPIDVAGIAEAQRRAAWAQVEEVLAGSEAIKVDLDGYPPDALVGYATEVGAELLVVGTRGRGELASLILGSTSHRAIHLATCDVLVVRSRDHD